MKGPLPPRDKTPAGPVPPPQILTIAKILARQAAAEDHAASLMPRARVESRAELKP